MKYTCSTIGRYPSAANLTATLHRYVVIERDGGARPFLLCVQLLSTKAMVSNSVTLSMTLVPRIETYSSDSVALRNCQCLVAFKKEEQDGLSSALSPSFVNISFYFQIFQ